MTSEELHAHEDRLDEIHGRIFDEMKNILIMLESLRKYGDAQDVYYESITKRLDAHIEQSAVLGKRFDSMLGLFGKIGATLNEHNERTAKLIDKFESYFGDGTGLEREN